MYKFNVYCLKYNFLRLLYSYSSGPEQQSRSKHILFSRENMNSGWLVSMSLSFKQQTYKIYIIFSATKRKSQ